MNENEYLPTNTVAAATSAVEVYPCRTLEIRRQGKLSRNIEVLDVNSTSALYAIKRKTLKPQLTFTSASDNQTVATVGFRNFSFNIDIDCRGQSSTVKQEWKWKATYTYISPTTSAALTWKAEQLTSMDLICQDERGIALARFHYAKWSMTKLGTLEIVGNAAAGGPMLEELVVTGVSVLTHYQMQAAAAS